MQNTEHVQNVFTKCSGCVQKSINFIRTSLEHIRNTQAVYEHFLNVFRTLKSPMCSTLTYLEHYTEHVHTYDASGRVGRCSRGVQRSREHALNTLTYQSLRILKEHYISEYSAEPKTCPTKPYMHNLVMCSKIDIKQNKTTTTTTNQKTSRTLVFFFSFLPFFSFLTQGRIQHCFIRGTIEVFLQILVDPTVKISGRRAPFSPQKPRNSTRDNSK